MNPKDGHHLTFVPICISLGRFTLPFGTLSWVLLHIVHHRPWPLERYSLSAILTADNFFLGFHFLSLCQFLAHDGTSHLGPWLPGFLKSLWWDIFVKGCFESLSHLLLNLRAWFHLTDLIIPSPPLPNDSVTNQLKQEEEKGLNSHYLSTDWHQPFHTDNAFHGNSGNVNFGRGLGTIFGTFKKPPRSDFIL